MAVLDIISTNSIYFQLVFNISFFILIVCGFFIYQRKKISVFYGTEQQSWLSKFSKAMNEHWEYDKDKMKERCGTEATLYLYFLKLCCLFFFYSKYHYDHL
jgi:hypothetical protein